MRARKIGIVRSPGRSQERIEKELTIIRQKRFAHYFLVVEEIVRQAPRTCGRGSVAASIVSYCLKITHVDPIKHHLFFERFLNPGRTDPPDIDIDFPWDERDEILHWVFQQYGQRSSGDGGKSQYARDFARRFGKPQKSMVSRLKTSRPCPPAFCASKPCCNSWNHRQTRNG